ncbi:hypothetical protein [Povalibacter sp.]|uniref:beta strand repeat-containing protein n=1 Tax=Povalibacter sp. TaxID=1962978 RepID=UPI002F41D7FF
MQLSIRNAAGRAELAEKQSVEGRTVLRLKHGERLEILDPMTGKAPAGVKAHRGGANGNDLVIESFGETVQIEGFFEQTAQGEEAIAVEFPGGGTPEITPATAELSEAGAVLDTGFAAQSGSFISMAQAGAAGAGAGAGAGAAGAGAAGGGAAAAGASNLWWIAGGVAGAGAAGAAIENNNSKSDARPETFELSRGAASVNEGETVTFTLNTTNVAPGTQYSYTLSGVSASDVAGGVLSGMVTIDANGRAVIQVTLLADRTTEGAETLTVAVAGQTSSAVVNDTSTTPVPTFAVSSSLAAVDEGNGVSFSLDTTNVAAGTQYAYTITGISPDDIVGGVAALTGTVTIDANGRAVVDIQLVADHTTEGLETLTFSVAGQTVAVNVRDTSLTPTFVLTVNQDDVKGSGFDDVIVGTSSTYNDGDIIDGGAGYDKLSLTLSGGTVADSETVKNVEQVDVRVTAGNGGAVELSMTDYDSSVQQININSARADLDITDQKSLADVSIHDVNGRYISLDYVNSVVAGDADKLNVTLEDVSGALHIDAGIEALDLQVNAGAGADSELLLTAEGATAITLTGGTAGQQQSIQLIANEGRAAGATFDATAFAGDVAVTDVAGGFRSFAYAVEFTRALAIGESASVTIAGHEYTVTAEDEEMDLDTVVTQLMYQVAADYGVYGSIGYGENGIALIITGLSGPTPITAQVAGESMTVLDTFDYTLNDGPTSTDLTSLYSSEVSTLRLGSGDDTVGVVGTGYGSGITADDNYDLGDGSNSLIVNDGGVHGTVRFGDGDGNMQVDLDIGAGARVSFGNGDSSVGVHDDISGDASISFAGGNNSVGAEYVRDVATIDFNGDGDNSLYAGEDITDRAAIRFNGDGNNSLDAYGINGNASVVFGNGHNAVEVSSISADASITFGDGDNELEACDIGGQANVQFGNGGNSLYVDGGIYGGEDSDGVTITFGDGTNTVYVGDGIYNTTVQFGTGDTEMWVDDNMEESSVSFGDGHNDLDVDGSVDSSILTFGDGPNHVYVYGDVNSSSFTFGAGDNLMEVWDNLYSSSFTFGDGNNEMYAGYLSSSTVTLGSGADSVWVSDEILEGSVIDLGAGNDRFQLGWGGWDGWSDAYVGGSSDASVVEMGEGDDLAVIRTSSEYTTDVVVGSGGFLRGGDGNDTLTVKAVDDIYALVARDRSQQVEVTFDGDYQVGQVVSVTIDAMLYEYTVLESDIVQGDSVATRGNVAGGLLAAIQDAGNAALAADWGCDENVIVLTGMVGNADVSVFAEGATAVVTQIADAGISGFETLNLVSVNPTAELEGGEDQDEWDYFYGDNERDSGDIAVDFSLVSGVQQINLRSEVELFSSTEEDERFVNGAYTTNEYGDNVVYTLTNLPLGLGEHISVEGNEVSATGNRQVERITIGNGTGDHAIGDVITVCIGREEYSITVTAEDLTGASAEEDALNIAARLAEVLAAGETGFTVALDGNVITMIGSSDRDVPVHMNSDGDNDSVDGLQCATATDDQQIDVSVTAVLAADADTDNDTLALTINGRGSFDLGIDGAWNGISLYSMGPEVAYENLSINVKDSFSHYIDTDENDDNAEFVRGAITLTGGVAGASIIVDDVMARSFTSTSESDVTVVFDSAADENADYDFTVSTQDGNDVADLRGLTFSAHSSVDLGAGVDRLVLGNGRLQANTVMSGSALLDEGRMFRNVSNVEELEFHGEDAMTFDDDAFAAGFEKLIVGEYSGLQLTVGDEFERDLAVEIEDSAYVGMTVHNAYDINVTADDDVYVLIGHTVDASGDFTLTADDDLAATLTSQGSGALTVTADDDASITVNQDGDGDITVSTDRRASIYVTQYGSGNVDVTTGSCSSTTLMFGEDFESAAAVNVTQTGSDHNGIYLSGLALEQEVTVDITLHGRGEASVVANLDSANSYNTDLEVGYGQGGIDKLVLRSNEDRGDSSNASVVISNDWATNDDDGGTVDFIVDASAVSASQYVLLNGSQETDATLELIGSQNSSNVLLGGAQEDYLKGGSQSDVLQGDSVLWGEDSDWVVNAAADTLEGGEGRDLYVFAQSQFETMDTIVGLDLGGATMGEDSVSDVIGFGVFLEAGGFDTIGPVPNVFIESLDNMLWVDTVVNNGSAANIFGLDLEAAVNSLFQANGTFEQSGSAATNAAGLFNYGDDTYLIAVGDDASLGNGYGFGSDDYIVKVTGYTGTLDMSDFVQSYMLG